MASSVHLEQPHLRRCCLRDIHAVLGDVSKDGSDVTDKDGVTPWPQGLQWLPVLWDGVWAHPAFRMSLPQPLPGTRLPGALPPSLPPTQSSLRPEGRSSPPVQQIPASPPLWGVLGPRRAQSYPWSPETSPYFFPRSRHLGQLWLSDFSPVCPAGPQPRPRGLCPAPDHVLKPTPQCDGVWRWSLWG